MQAADKQIADILERYGEEVTPSTVWRVQGQPVIYHKALERIAARARMVFDMPTVLRAEADEAVLIVRGYILGEEDRAQWAFGEAKINVNYKVSGKQAAYPFAMAEKRGKDRCILKLIGLHGLLYSEEEADSFQQEAPPRPQLPPEPEPLSAAIMRELRSAIDRKKTAESIITLMQSTPVQEDLKDLTQEERDEARAYATQRMRALGWHAREPA